MFVNDYFNEQLYWKINVVAKLVFILFSLKEKKMD